MQEVQLRSIPTTKTATIADNGTASTGVSAESALRGTLSIPAGWVGTALTYEGSNDGSTYVAMHDCLGAALGHAAAASGLYAIPGEAFGMRFFRVVSNASETGGPLTLTFYIWT